ncbi:hypothetical protein BU26DRAFT_550204 [Trematosphaeria pertusa]|uniref:Uncharacterized protein n=1 Tax=Trematosphaeria pertusa TaxID=390896 RepID=A0A6A6IJZ3_9PLEO|nr:uncharacterized protein BU26DRAFT_550204 [Trematosphaeria pertusa]KAF2249890.1 hypothetical protein BU26DRAFT_550204 [Trematosphaeria pertusa]
MPPKKKVGRDPYTTLAIAVSCLVLGIPVSGVAINLELTFMATQNINPSDAIIQSPHIALFAAAVLAILSSVVVMLGSIILRHMSPNNVPVGLVSFGLAGVNLAGQLIILALIYITNSLHPESKSRNDVKFANGVYEVAGGKEFTRETWSCMMGNLYLAQEPWSTNACSEYHYARYCTILLVNTAALLLGIAYWPVRNFLFGGSQQPKAG